VSPGSPEERVGWLGRRDDRARLLAFFLIALAWASLTSVPGGALALACALLLAVSGSCTWPVASARFSRSSAYSSS